MSDGQEKVNGQENDGPDREDGRENLVQIMSGDVLVCEGELTDITGVEGTVSEDGKYQDVILHVRARALKQSLDQEAPAGQVVYVELPPDPVPAMVLTPARVQDKPIMVEIPGGGVSDITMFVGENPVLEFSITNGIAGEVQAGQLLFRKTVTIRFDCVTASTVAMN